MGSMGMTDSNDQKALINRVWAESSLARREQLAQSGVLLLLALAAAIAYLTRHCLAVANTTIQAEIGCNNEQFGYLYGAFSLGYLFFQVPGGWLGQRLGTRIALPMFVMLWSVTTILTALVMSIEALIGIRFLFGLAQGGLVPNQAKVLQEWISPDLRGMASSVLIVGMSVGAVASLSLTSAMMDFVNWRTIFVAYGCVGFVYSGLFFLLFRSSPREISYLETGFSQGQDSKKATSIPRGTRSNIGLAMLLVHQNIWGLIFMALFKAAGYNLLVTFLPALLEFAYGATKSQTGGLTSWSLISVVVGSMLGGPLIDWVQRLTSSKRYSRSGVGGIALALAGLFTIFAGFATTASTLSAALAIASFFSGIASASPWVATIDIGGLNTAVVMGLMNSASALAGIAISPFVGRLVDSIRSSEGNWSLVIWLHAIFYILAALSWLAVNPDQPLESPGDIHAV